MSIFSREMAEQILGFCYFTSTNDMEPDIRKKLRAFADAPYTDAELFDFLVEVSKIQCDRLRDPSGKTVLCVGYISGFVQAACDLSAHYSRPEDGGVSAPIPGEVLEKWKRV